MAKITITIEDTDVTLGLVKINVSGDYNSSMKMYYDGSLTKAQMFARAIVDSIQDTDLDEADDILMLTFNNEKDV